MTHQTTEYRVGDILKDKSDKHPFYTMIVKLTRDSFNNKTRYVLYYIDSQQMGFNSGISKEVLDKFYLKMNSEYFK